MGLAEGMRSITGSIVSSHNERLKELNDLNSDTRKTLKGFEQERKKTGKEQAKNLADFAEDLSTGVEEMLKGFRKNHRKMSDEQAKNLIDFTKNLAGDIGSMLSGFAKERSEMSEELRGRLDQKVKEIETHVKKRLKEFDKAHAEMSGNLKSSLTEYVGDMVKDVRKLLNEHSSDMKKARGAWLSMSKTLARAREGMVAVPEIVSGPTAGMTEGTKAKELPAEMKLEKKILNFVKSHPEGVKVGEMEEHLGVARSRLGVIAKGLLEEGRVRKEENLYFPL